MKKIYAVSYTHLSAMIKVVATDEIVRKIANVSGDDNPVHLDDHYAEQTIFKKRIACLLYTSKLVRKVLIVECCLLACMVILMAGTNLGKRWKTMVSISDNNGSIEGNEAEEPEKIVTVDEGSVSVRIIELKMAVKSFINSPIFGQGIGYRWQADGLDYGGPVLYMHNILAYILMDFGILGAAYIIIILVAIIRMNAKMLKKSNGKIEDGGVFLLSFSVIAMAFVYANFFAVFRSIEFVIICSVFFLSLIHI